MKTIDNVKTIVSPPIEKPATNAGASGAQPAHLAYLDGFRGLAALYVVLHHAASTLTALAMKDTHPSIWFFRIVKPLMFGHFSVDLFIVLSGFCLMLPVVRSGGVLRGGVMGFFKRRARRILPPYYFALILALALDATLLGHKTGTHWDVSLPVTRSSILAHLFLLHDLSQQWASRIDHPMWSIAVEWQIYFLFPILLISWKRLGAGATVIAATILSYTLVFSTMRTDLSGITAQYISLFALGMLAASIAYDKDRWNWARKHIPWVPIALVLAGIVVVLCQKFPDLVDRRLPFVDFLVGGLSFVLLILSSIKPTGFTARVTSLRPVALLGTFGYSIYLIHAPLLQLIWQYGLRPLHLGYGITLAALVFLGIPVIILISYLFFLIFERPFMSSLGKARPQSVPASRLSDAAGPSPMRAD